MSIFKNLTAVAMLFVVLVVVGVAVGAETGDYYTEPQVYGSRPSPTREIPFGDLGVTGLKLRIFPGVKLTVEETTPGTPAAGKFKAGELIRGVNGVALKGRNLNIDLGDALTKAEATDGRLRFDVETQDGKKRTVEIKIPVLDAYSKTWPLNCAKSKRIIREAAEYYANVPLGAKDLTAAQAHLFLLSTGDDKYLPRVKAYLAQFTKNPRAIGDNTWHNGYNGILTGEYYLRTGDKSVLPLLQYYCDDAHARQKYGCGWVHWGPGVSPGYVAGGLMNPAGSQLLTTMLLGKECGVKVNEKALLGALRFWYRFAGRGSVAYGDHRGEGGLGSNGKDGMSAAAMLIASGAEGDTTIYKLAADYQAMSMVDSYVGLARGHGDNGRGDAHWRSISPVYVMDKRPKAYRAMMDRLRWYYDLSRRPGGAFGVATTERFNDIPSGAFMAIAYTAPLKKLRITGGPRTKYSKDFTLPELLWGTKADVAFTSYEPHPDFFKYGKAEPAHIPFYKFGSAYAASSDLSKVSKAEILKNVHHPNYMIRAQAAKALRQIGALDDLERLLGSDDPRLRRAALDGIIDYRYWFAMSPSRRRGEGPLKTEQMTPGMLEAIAKMISDPKEAWYVVDGALFAASLAPAEFIEKNLSAILPWTENEDWWLRESAFHALMGSKTDDALFKKVLPTLMAVYTSEYHIQPRARMLGQLQKVLRARDTKAFAKEKIMVGLLRAVKDSRIIPDTAVSYRSAEGAHNIQGAASMAMTDPKQTLAVARAIRDRLPRIPLGQLSGMLGLPGTPSGGGKSGLYAMLDKLPADQKQELLDLLYKDYRKEMLKRARDGKPDMLLINTIVGLTALKGTVQGWQSLGSPSPNERLWRYTSFDPQREEDRMHPRIGKRFRVVALPKGLEKWYLPKFDDSKWKQGKAPIGVGRFTGSGFGRPQGTAYNDWKQPRFKTVSPWGDGEFLLMRTTFELDSLDYDVYRLRVLNRNGFKVYLNGRNIHTYVWWKSYPHYWDWPLEKSAVAHLRKGTNTLAVYSNAHYAKAGTDGKEYTPVAQTDVYIEGLRLADLLKE